MLLDDLGEFQAEQFLEFYKRQNPIEDIKVCFSLWSESKDFQEEDSKKIWEKVLDRIKQ